MTQNSNAPVTVIGMPLVGDLPAEAFASHVHTICQVAGLSNVILQPPIRMVPHDRARAAIVGLARKVEADYLFFMDDDTLSPPDAFPRMLKLLCESKAAMVSGHYYRRGWPYHCVWAKEFPGHGLHPADTGVGVHELDFTGLGCALIDFRWLIANVQEPYFTMEMDDKLPATNVTDDMTFCRKIREAGGVILGDASIRCTHLGRRVEIGDSTVTFLRSEYLTQERENSNGSDWFKPECEEESKTVAETLESDRPKGVTADAQF